jgi:hypothetical protein
MDQILRKVFQPMSCPGGRPCSSVAVATKYILVSFGIAKGRLCSRAYPACRQRRANTENVHSFDQIQEASYLFTEGIVVRSSAFGQVARVVKEETNR